MNHKNRITAAALFAVLTAAQLTACGTAGTQEANTTAAGTDGTDLSAAVTTEEVTTQSLTAHLPEKDYGGKTFDILTAGNWAYDWTGIYDFQAEEQNGDAINDAVFARNSLVEDRFHVKITDHNFMGDAARGAKNLKNSVTASDNAYDASLMGAYDVTSLTYNNYLTQLTDLEYLDLSKPWWDARATADTAIANKVFYTTGDISTLDNDCTFCILFNKKLLSEYELDNPYELVKSGKWTIDKFTEMVSQVSSDLNGDSKHDEKDLYGFAIWHEAMRGLVHGIGERFCSLDDKGNLTLTLNSERVISAIDKFSKVAYDRTLSYSTYHSGDSAGSDRFTEMFCNGQVLFHNRYLNITKQYRNMETDFGILPYPKLDETQDQYYSTVGSYGCSFICVPAVVEDSEMSGLILEAMAAESVNTVTPAYYDVTLEGKIIRDNESAEMLDIILGNRVFDLGLYYEVGKYNVHIMELFYNSSTDFASMYNKFEKAAQKKVDKVNQAFADMED